MLINLHVKNLVLIKEVDVDFNNGLIVLTGETGAGKSLILGSINIALGSKASKELIRVGTDYSLVELSFKVDDKCYAKLKDMDIYIEEDNIVTVTRKISEGRSVSKINGETVNLSTLKNVMALLVDIYGQHEHQSLLYPSKHMDILDEYIKDTAYPVLKELKDEYQNYLSLKTDLSNYTMDEQKRAREMEFAKFEVKEIEDAQLTLDEDIKLEEEYRNLSSLREVVSNLSDIYNLINYEAEGGLGDIIGRAIQNMNQIKFSNKKIEQFKDSLYDIDSMCRDLSSDLYDYTSEYEYNPEYLSEIEGRLNTINGLKIKYGQTIESILSYGEEKQKYLEKLINYENEINQIREKMSASYARLSRLSETVSELRKSGAEKLEQMVIESLKELNFEHVNFKIDISKKDKINEKGFDKVEFLISMNIGQPLKPLAKVASGGELSRVMLAIKSILAQEDEIDTMIFDEIDTGISGVTAQKVSEKLAKISRKHQVICISHLSQIAAMADEHFLIEKVSDDSSTTTNIKKLNRSESIKELIRINGAGEMTSASIAHAEEMKDMADRTKCNLF